MSIGIIIWSVVIGLGIGVVATICFLWWCVSKNGKNNCEHVNYYYADKHPVKVWRCHDCGIDFE